MSWNPFKRKPKSYVLDQKYKVVEAFKLNGVTYYQFDDTFQVPAGRAFTALTFYQELEMRCDANYLDKHTRAMEILFSDPKKININAMVLLNQNLKERRRLAPFPDHIYKLASVIYMDETESPYSYDFKYNQQKIEIFKSLGKDFFLKIPIGDLMPSLTLPERNLEMYFQVSEEIDKMHHSDLSEVLSSQQ
jgi:hypothetical protein